MNKRAALCFALLKGDIINVSNCLKICGYSNPGREIPRKVEKPFGLIVSRVRQSSSDQFGNSYSYTDYRLNRTLPENKEGIEKLRAFVKEHLPEITAAKTDKEAQLYKQQQLFINTL